MIDLKYMNMNIGTYAHPSESWKVLLLASRAKNLYEFVSKRVTLKTSSKYKSVV